MKVTGTPNPGLYYILSDHLGSTSVVTDSSGIEVSRTGYYPFGEPRYSLSSLPNSALPTDRLYTGQQQVAGIGLYNYKARFYDAGLGRFVSADDVTPGGPQGQNRYSYVNNSPINHNDPTGHCLVGNVEVPDGTGGCNNSQSSTNSGNGGDNNPKENSDKKNDTQVLCGDIYIGCSMSQDNVLTIWSYGSKKSFNLNEIDAATDTKLDRFMALADKASNLRDKIGDDIITTLIADGVFVVGAMVSPTGVGAVIAAASGVVALGSLYITIKDFINYGHTTDKANDLFSNL